jgi:hypothetical protein
MPPEREKLPETVIADLVEWVKQGAPDPRDVPLEAPQPQLTWEAAYHQRLMWWSLQPLAAASPPLVQQQEFVRNDVDRYILAALEAKGLQSAQPAERRVLARRLGFAITGLPPSQESVDQFLADQSADADATFVRSLLDSPHFGVHWARHWMDVVHYADTHGYEWDVPAKNAWRYRDYLIRALNADVPFRQLVLEHIAGDLIEPRIDPCTGLNESLHGPMALRLGERRHGDNAQTEGVTQEAVANVIDTLSKGFLATTVACAQCHDHKLDAIAQRDYFALAGVLMSSRWSVRCLDSVDPNEQVKSRLQEIPPDGEAGKKFPESLVEFWQRARVVPLGDDEFAQERARRHAENETNLKLVADFALDGAAGGWQWDGLGMRHGLAVNGEFVVAEEGQAAIADILPAGRWSHVWSERLAGAVRSPLLDGQSAKTLSVGCAGSKHAAYAMVIDHAFHSERMQFIDQKVNSWLTMTAGEFNTLEGSIDRARRRVYFELATKALNNYFPPRTTYGKFPETELADERSWMGITQVYEHPPGKAPLDELARFAPLFADDADWAARFANLLLAAVERWSRNECDSEDARLLSEALQAKLLPNDMETNPKLA